MDIDLDLIGRGTTHLLVSSVQPISIDASCFRMATALNAIKSPLTSVRYLSFC